MLKKTSFLLLALSTFFMSACDRYAQTQPVLAEITGRYIPQNYQENGIRKTSQLTLDASHKCTLIDFPVVTYFGNEKSSIDYYTSNGEWDFDDSTGNWILTIKLPNNKDFSLRILKNKSIYGGKIPYVLCQEGEDLEYDALFFIQK
jgi:hypothetical protein